MSGDDSVAEGRGPLTAKVKNQRAAWWFPPLELALGGVIALEGRALQCKTELSFLCAPRSRWWFC